MDTNDISELDLAGGVDIIYDKGCSISVNYIEPSAATNRSVVVFGDCPLVVDDAHMFLIGGACGNAEPLGSAVAVATYNILLKLNQLLSISFCTVVGCGAYGDTVLRLNAHNDGLAPWTLSMIINPDYEFKGEDLSKINERLKSGTHLFYVLQNRKDLTHYDRFFNGSLKGLFNKNLIQGWSYQNPSKSFYADSQINQHAVSLSSADLRAFLEYMSFNKNNSEALALYNIYREY